MPYNFDYFISYAHNDNKTNDGSPGFVDVFYQKLINSSEHQKMFGGKVKVFFDKEEIRSMSDWDNRIRSALASSRFLIALMSPN
ncbi:MAG: toll/interleukin-1 receptor domain-containing protein [Thermoguttaceae bacterium]|nr:toll/interleukin-1 receptor domain-containing protein [Thermoguttaceae bacterium]